MTREEALNRAINIVSYVEAHLAKSKAAREEAVKIIEVLEQELCVTPQPKTDVLDKIRADILEEKECAYADFDRYKVEYLGQDWDDVYDSLPQDDFRYGMERCIDIIDKYKTGSGE